MTALASRRRAPGQHRATKQSHAQKPSGSGLFGRGMLYVLVWSLQLVVSSAVSPVLAHLLPAAQFGYLSTSIALFQLFSVLMVFGLDQALLMEHGDGGGRRVSAPRVIWLSAATATVLTAALLATGSAWAGSAGFPGFHGIIVLAVLWSGPGAVNLVILSLLRAHDRFGAFVVVNLLTSIGGQVGGVFVVLGGSRTAAAYGWAGVAAQYAALALGLLLVRPQLRGVLDTVWAKRVMRAGSSLAASAVALFLLNTGDRVLLQRLDGAESVARYQIAYVVGSVPILLLTFLNQAWLPRILEIADRATQWRTLARSRDLLFGVLAPAVAALVIVSPLALRLLAPADYGVSRLVGVVFWVAVAAVPVADCAASTRALIARRRTGSVATATAGAAVLNVALNIVFIPVWHEAGSAAATFVSFAAQAYFARGLLGREHALARPSVPTKLVIAGFVAAALAAAIVTASATEAAVLGGQLAVALALGGYALLRLLQAQRAEL